MAIQPLEGFRSRVASFDEELRDQLLKRCKLVYGLGFVIGLAVILFYGTAVPIRPAVDSAFAPYALWVYALYAFSVGLAAALLFLGRWSLRRLVVIDYVVLTFNIVLSHFIAVVFDVAEVPTFAVALLLIVHAAFLPVPVASQVGLAVTGALGYAIVSSLGYALVPAIAEYWLEHGGPARFRLLLLEGTFQLTILAAVSIVITKTLYHLRESLHEARRLGSYTIDRRIGSGGMGQVFLGQHALMCRPAAVKVIEAATTEDADSLARFEREVQLSAGLTHPNTITVYDFGRTKTREFYYAMEYLEGLDLQELVQRFGSISPARAVHILVQVCGSLAEAHTRHIVHRDIKPSNIYLTQRGGLYDFVKVLDFGLAKEIRIDEAAGITKTGALFGTPLYLAPETVRGAETVDERADLYALGAVAYWLLAGRPPFTAASSVEVIVDHVKTTPSPPSAFAELAIPADLDGIVMKCLEKKPQDRFQSAAELEAALRSVRFAEPWTNRKAHDWWELHGPEISHGGPAPVSGQVETP